MHRIFLALAVTVGTLLVVSFATGFFVPTGRGGMWHDLHFLISLVAAMATLLVHSIVFTYFLGTGRWVKEVVYVYQLPPWVWSQAVKNKRRVFPFEFLSMMLIGASRLAGRGVGHAKGLQPKLAFGRLGGGFGVQLGSIFRRICVDRRAGETAD